MTDSTFTDNFASVEGGGIANSGTGTVSGCSFTGNSAPYGGGIYNNGTLTVTDDSTFSSNSAGVIAGYEGSGGGGIDNEGTATVIGSTFTNNSAGYYAVPSYGGGLLNDGTVTVTNSIFTGNSASENGGGIANQSGTLTVTDNTFTHNSCVFGGGISNAPGAIAMVTNSTFTSNASPGNGAEGEGDGGGLLNDGTLSVTNSLFTGNSATSYGGGLFNDGTLTVNSNTVTDNSATNGGGVFNTGDYGGAGVLTVVGSTFTNDSVTVTSIFYGPYGTYDGVGGGICNEGTATVINSTLTGNTASGPPTSYFSVNDVGGGVANIGTLTVGDSTFASNSASDGGGIWNTGMATVSDSTFTSNSASGLGGGYGGGLYSSGTATLIDSTFTSNSANEGGGLVNFGMVTVIDSTFTGNSAGDGGGLDNGGTAMVTNCTVSGNTSQDAGGGIANGEGGSLTLNNTIVAGNTSTSTSDNDISGTVSSTSAFNLIGDGSGISNLTDLEASALNNLIGTTADPINPLLAPLADYGGPTQTMALLPGSPAIDAGSNALAVDANGNPLTTDQRGLPRVVGTSVDIGAFESQGFTLTPVTGSTPQGTPVNSPFANPLAVIVTANNPMEPVAGGVVTFSAPASGASANLSGTTPVTLRVPQRIDTTIGWNGIDGYQPFGTDGAETMGQTFNSGRNNVLKDFSFYLNPEYGDLNVVFKFYVMAWNGQEATGPVLFQSGLLSTAGLPTYTAAPGCFTEFTIDTQDLSLMSNTNYVAFLSSVGLEAYSNAGAVVGARYDNPYQGGGLFFSVQRNDFSLLSTTDWVNAGDVYDFAFKADLLSVQEPNSIIGSNGEASVTATANAIGGQYTVSASTAGAAAPASFVLTNQFLSQTISFGPLAGQTYGVAPITLSATDTSDLPVSFTVLSGPATLSGNVLTVNGAGNVVVEASQPGNATYSAAAPVDESFTVNPAPLIVTATGESMTYGGTVPVLTYTYAGLVNGDNQRHVQRRPGDQRHVVEQRRRLHDHRGESGCDRQLHDRHVQRGHADGERGTVDHHADAGPVHGLWRCGAGADLHRERFRQRRSGIAADRRAGHDSHLDQRGRQLSLHAGFPDRGNELRAGTSS